MLLGSEDLAKRGGKTATLALAAGPKPKMRKASRRNWTKAKEAAFLTRLAETCNVSAAARAAGMSKSGAYERRRKVAAFRAAWAEAIGEAYRDLELAMLDRALNGTEKVVVRKDGSEERMRDYPYAIAMNLLKMHRESAGAAAIEEPPEEDIDEVRERILQKLERLAKQRGL